MSALVAIDWAKKTGRCSGGMMVYEVCRLQVIACPHQRHVEIGGGMATVCVFGRGCQFQVPTSECVMVQPKEER